MTILLRNVKPNLLAATLAGILSAALVWFSTARYGIGLSPDSLSYRAAAENLCAGFGLVGADGLIITLWPPLFPALLGTLVCSSGFDSVEVGRLLNTVLHGLLVYVLSKIGMAIVTSPPVRLCVPLLFMFSFPLLRISTMLWTETLFLLLVLLALMNLVRFSIQEGNERALVTVILYAACAMLLRFLGVALLPVIFIGVLVLPSSFTRRERFIKAALVSFTAALPLILWLLALSITGAPAGGERSAEHDGVIRQLIELVQVTHQWFWPTTINMTLSGALFALALLLWSRSEDSPCKRTVTVHGLWILAYGLTLVAVRSSVELERISLRYVTPLLPSLVVGGVFLIEKLYLFLKRSSPRFAAGLCTAILSLFILLSLLSLRPVIDQWRTDGVGDYTHRFFMESEVVRVLAQQKIPRTAVLYSNAADFLQWKLGLQVRDIPSEIESRPFIPEEGSTLIWLRPSLRPSALSPEEVASRVSLQPLMESEAGGVFRVVAKR